MPNDPLLYQALLTEKLRLITADPNEWQGFVRSLSRHYKYSFEDALLIYAQLPNASACAAMSVWNKMGRWVNRGARGIALLDASGKRLKLRYVFDVADTNSREGHLPRTWELTSDTYPAVLETLANAYAVKTEEQDLPAALSAAASVLASDNCNDYLEQLENCLLGSALAELNADDRKQAFIQTVTHSTAAAYLIRGGWEAEAAEYLNACKSCLSLFNTPETAALLGGAACDIAEMGLREIESTVRAEQKKWIRTFAKNGKVRDNGPTVQNPHHERSRKDEPDLQTERRLPTAEPDTGQTAPAEQVRADAPAQPQEPAPPVVSDDAGQRPADAPSAIDPNAGQRTGGADGGEPSRKAGRDRGTESLRPDGVDGADEQHPAQRGGAGADQLDLYLSESFYEPEPELPTVEQQIESIQQAEAENAPALSFSQEQIDAVLTGGSSVQQGKLRIYEQFQKHPSIKENADFLKEEYGIGGASGYAGRPDISYNAKGLYIGGMLWNKEAVFLSWKKVAQRIAVLIADDRYLTPEEKSAYEKYRAEKAGNAPGRITVTVWAIPFILAARNTPSPALTIPCGCMTKPSR